MDKLNICFDGRILYNCCNNDRERTGIYFVAKNVIQKLSKRDINLYLYFEKDNKNVDKIINDLNIDKSKVLYSDSDFSNINSFLSPIFAIPDCIDKFPNVSQYIILYDIIPLIMSEYFVGVSEQSWFKEIIEHLNSDRYYFPISHHTKQDFLKYFSDKLDRDKMDVIPLSTNLEYKPNNDVELLSKAKEKYNIPNIESYEKYYYNKDLRRDMAQKGIGRAKLFSWDKCVDIILNRMYEVEKKKQNKPLVTIITATYNLIKNGRKDYFVQNLESVKNQTYSNIEHIIIDGASTDGTLELLEEYQNKGWIKYYSEPDKGIYDAINKGILKANGKYVVCLNSDDFYCNNKAVEYEVMKLEENDADACYGNSNVYDEDGKFVCTWKGKDSIHHFFLGDMPNHQTFMIKTDVMKELGLYNLKYKVSSDSNFIYKMSYNHKKFVYIDSEIVVYRLGGYSKQQQAESWQNQEDSFNEFWGEEYCLTPLDIHDLAHCNFVNLPIDQAINLGSRLKNQNWIEQYFSILFKHYHKNTNNWLSILKYKQDSRNRKWYFLGLPIFRIKQINKHEKKYYIFAIPVCKIAENL